MSLIERVMESETLSEETKQRFVDGWILGRVRAKEREQLELVGDVDRGDLNQKTAASPTA
jgi:hypothetical protein